MTIADEPALFFNPLQPGYLDDPYTHMGEIRNAHPVHMIIDRWGLFRYDDCFSLLRDASLSVDDEKSDVLDSERADQFRIAAEAEGIPFEPNRSMLTVDPPDHTRLRRLVTKAFTPRSIEQLRPQVQQLVDQSLDSMQADGVADVVDRLAFTLPFDVINLMLGMPEADKDKIKDWSGAIVKTLDPILTPEEVAAATVASIRMDAHIADVIEWKRSNLADDLLTRLIEAEEDGDRLTTKELAAQVALLFIAGHETTVNLIGTGLFELLRNPEQMSAWRADESLGTNAVDELLRYVSPVQMSRRVATADLEFQGQHIPARSFVLAILASANRDPDKWGPTANDLDLGREGAGQHLAFGSGSHYCLGASLAKLEAEVALQSFITRFPNATIDGVPAWNGRLNLRGLESLPLRVG